MNYGIWHAAIVNASALKEAGFQTELWFPSQDVQLPPDVIGVPLSGTNISDLKKVLEIRGINPQNDIVISHGAWQFPTRWGAWLRKKGFRWIYVPQGMLEPWPMKHKWLKKKIYFNLLEKKLVTNANFIRAVSRPEEDNLRMLFPDQLIGFVPNGVSVSTSQIPQMQEKTGAKRRYLFLSRLHAKKNIAGLIRAWQRSVLNNHQNAELLIVGPDQGELAVINQLLKHSDNIRYLGALFGSTKNTIVGSATFFVLPSFSEGLPSSLLEAMGAGLVPIITSGCNLPEALDERLGFAITTEIESIKEGLEKSFSTTDGVLLKMSERNRQFIRSDYSIEAITDLQLHQYLLKSQQ